VSREQGGIGEEVFAVHSASFNLVTFLEELRHTTITLHVVGVPLGFEHRTFSNSEQDYQHYNTTLRVALYVANGDNYVLRNLNLYIGLQTYRAIEEYHLLGYDAV
jgi:hypothetical protein